MWHERLGRSGHSSAPVKEFNGPLKANSPRECRRNAEKDTERRDELVRVRINRWSHCSRRQQTSKLSLDNRHGFPGPDAHLLFWYPKPPPKQCIILIRSGNHISARRASAAVDLSSGAAVPTIFPVSDQHSVVYFPSLKTSPQDADPCFISRTRRTARYGTEKSSSAW